MLEILNVYQYYKIKYIFKITKLILIEINVDFSYLTTVLPR